MNPRQVPYKVKRISSAFGIRYLIFKRKGNPPVECWRKGRFFWCIDRYHRTLRDAIVYAVYGI